MAAKKIATATPDPRYVRPLNSFVSLNEFVVHVNVAELTEAKFIYAKARPERFPDFPQEHRPVRPKKSRFCYFDFDELWLFAERQGWVPSVDQFRAEQAAERAKNDV